MGSLPNLHELSRSESESLRPIKCHLGQPMRLPCHTNHHHQLHHTRSAGATHVPLASDGAGAWDDFLVERMPGYGGRGIMLRRRDSLASSLGASSVRRLIAVVRSTPSRLGPAYSRRVLLRTFTALCLAHFTFTAAFLPLHALQSSTSPWFWSQDTDVTTASYDDHQNVYQFRPHTTSGTLLFALLYSTAAVSSLFSPCLVASLGVNLVLVLFYSCGALFFALHLYPAVVALAPAYCAMGAWLGVATGARIACYMALADKMDDDIDTRDEAEGGRRVMARIMQGAQDLGMVVGNAGAAVMVWLTTVTSQDGDATGTTLGSTLLGALYAETERGERVCGYAACPLDRAVLVSLPANVSADAVNAAVLPCRTAAVLASIAVGCSVMAAVVATLFVEKIKPLAYRDPNHRGASVAALRMVRAAFLDPKLQLVAPLSAFIGLEQGFMYADFSKFYVLCALGVPNISLVFLSMGMLQSVAAFTLSMMLAHVARCLVIGVGLVFHLCLLLVLLLWKPSGDDPALFYVIAAAWGVCNAIWETLAFSLLLSLYPQSWSAPVAQSCFFRCLGLCLAFSLHGLLCTDVKLYLLGGALLLSVAPFTYLEMRLAGRQQQPL